VAERVKRLLLTDELLKISYMLCKILFLYGHHIDKHI